MLQHMHACGDVGKVPQTVGLCRIMCDMVVEILVRGGNKNDNAVCSAIFFSLLQQNYSTTEIRL